MSKSQRVKGENKYEQEPLDASEVSMTVGLLHRAVVNGQSQLLMEGYRKYPERLAYAETARTVMEVMKEIASEDSPSSSGYPSPAMTGGMSKAAKRRLDLEEVGTSDWEKVSAYGGSSIAQMFPAHVGKPASKGPMPDASNPQLLIIKQSEIYPMKSLNLRIHVTDLLGASRLILPSSIRHFYRIFYEPFWVRPPCEDPGHWALLARPRLIRSLLLQGHQGLNQQIDQTDRVCLTIDLQLFRCRWKHDPRTVHGTIS